MWQSLRPALCLLAAFHYTACNLFAVPQVPSHRQLPLCRRRGTKRRADGSPSYSGQSYSRSGSYDSYSDSGSEGGRGPRSRRQPPMPRPGRLSDVSGMMPCREDAAQHALWPHQSDAGFSLICCSKHVQSLVGS